MSDFLSSAYLWIKAIHIMAVISWMAALFYLPRLFVYHVEKGAHDTNLASAYEEMEFKLLKVIMNPAMIATWVLGLALMAVPGVVDFMSLWFWIKLVMVLGMTGFHGWCAGQRKKLAAGDFSRPGRHYRMMNEVPTILMFIIVIMVVVKPF